MTRIRIVPGLLIPLVFAAGLAGLAGSSRAQDTDPPPGVTLDPAPPPPPLFTLALAGGLAVRGPLAPRPESHPLMQLDADYRPWDDSKHLAWGVTELALLEFLPWALARWIRDFDQPSDNYAIVNPDTWWNNLQKGWEYDTDNFTANHLGHPYHGALFFNTGRANGYDFYESMAFSLGGSVVWEFFGENYRPSINDWIYTGVGGVNLGEILFRLSTMVTDNTATGSGRVWQEIGGTLVNPVRGFTRLISGETARVFPNPSWRDPANFRLTLDAGARAFDKNGDLNFPEEEIDGTFVMRLAYGNEFTPREPFSAFSMRLALATGVPHLAGINTTGHLFGGKLAPERHRLDVNLEFDYNNLNKDIPEPGDSIVFKGIVFGSVTVNPHVLSRFRLGDGTDLVTHAGVGLALMASTPNDYYMDPTAGGGRNYDFGPGAGMTLKASILGERWEYVTLHYRGLWIFTQSEPAESRHHIHFLILEAQYPLTPFFTVGVELGRYWRESVYDTFPDVNRSHSLGRLFFRTAIISI